MDSFLSLFNSNGFDIKDEEYNKRKTLPPEPQAGNVEYKLKIINPSKQRFEHLVTQVCIYLLFICTVIESLPIIAKIHCVTQIFLFAKRITYK